MSVHVRLSILVSMALLWLAGTAGAQAQSGNMSFFVTSAGPGKGADLGGLAGADQTCRSSHRRPGRGARPGART
jgi:hypothetical protein